MPPQAPRPQFEDLLRQFRQGLGPRWQDLLQAKDATAAHALLHRLAGASGMYGEQALSECAQDAMRSLASCAHGAALATDPDYAQALQRLRQAMEQSAGLRFV
jgi:hypothetical protein